MGGSEAGCSMHPSRAPRRGSERHWSLAAAPAWAFLEVPCFFGACPVLCHVLGLSRLPGHLWDAGVQLSGAGSHELTGANCCFCSAVQPCGQSVFASKQLVLALIRALGCIMPLGGAEKGSAPQHSRSPSALPGDSQHCLGISTCLELCLGKDLPLPEL